VISRGAFSDFEANSKSQFPYDHLPKREDILRHVVSCFTKTDIVVTTTGKTSRELFELREQRGEGHHQDFLTVGSMGCSASIGLGLSLAHPHRRVVVIDGDGAVLMRMEAMVTIGHEAPSNFIHIVVDNNAYESTGNQQTLSHTVDFVGIAQAVGYRTAKVMSNFEVLNTFLKDPGEGPHLVVIPSRAGARSDLGRPTKTPKENKEELMGFLKEKINVSSDFSSRHGISA